MKKFNLEKNENLFAYILNFPSLIVIFLVIIFPVGYSFYISLHTWNLKRPWMKPFIGLSNYFSLMTSSDFLLSLQRTFIFVFFTLSITVIFGLMVALLLTQQFKGRGLLRAIILIPWAIPNVVNGIMWKWILDASYGILNYLLKSLGLISEYIPFLAQKFTAFLFVVIATSWKRLPFSIILLMSALQTIPEELYEAATVDGASVWQKFKSITLPMISPTLMVVLIFQTMLAFRVFDLIYVLTSGGPGDSTEVVGWLLYQEAFQLLHFGRGSAIGYIIAIITFIFAIGYYKLLNKKIY